MTTWVKVWEREYSLNRMDQVMESLQTDFAKEILGFRLVKSLAIKLPDGNDAFFAEKKTWGKVLRITSSWLSKKSRFKSFIKYYKVTKRNFIQLADIVGRAAEKTDSENDLIRLFRQYHKANSDYLLVGQWCGFNLGEVTDVEIRKFIERKIKNVKKQEDLFRTVLFPDKMSQIRREREHLLEISLVIQPNKKDKMLKEHVRLYQWIPCINLFQPPPWDEAFFKKELRQINPSQAQTELSRLRKSFRQTRKNFSNLIKGFKEHDRGFLLRAHAIAFIKDDRDDARRKAYFLAAPLYKKIASVLKIMPADLLLYTSQEIVDALKSRKTISRRQLRQRKEGYALVTSKAGNFVVKIGREYSEILKVLEANQIKTNILKGVVACKGRVKGQAKIVFNVYSISKVKDGDILITVATHPDYLPAMRIAGAIVTDEGGLTSHAAIVSRELQTPCVVGTKIATKVFKDGDLVEVDANRGIVRKLDDEA